MRKTDYLLIIALLIIADLKNCQELSEDCPAASTKLLEGNRISIRRDRLDNRTEANRPTSSALPP